jgi:hypothetical protein
MQKLEQKELLALIDSKPVRALVTAFAPGTTMLKLNFQTPPIG